MKVGVLTGAGISAESGIPTFRGKDGLWKQYRPEDLATPEAFARDPVLVWSWYVWRRSIILRAQPNPAHRALVELEQALEENFLLITQNVDNLHRRAGNIRVVELHGNIFRERCTSCGMRRMSEERYPETALPPRCPACGGVLRPDVVWFGETLPSEALEQAFAWVKRLQNGDVFLVVGTSGQVYPAAALPHEAHRRGARVVVVNLDPTPYDGFADEVHHGPAASILPGWVEAFLENPASPGPAEQE